MNDLRLAQVHNIYRLIIYTVCATCIYDVCGVECCIRLCLRRTRASKLWSNRRREYSISLTANCVAELNNPASEIVWLTKARMQTSTFIHMHRCSQCVLRLTKQNAENCILIRFNFRINVNFDAFFLLAMAIRHTAFLTQYSIAVQPSIVMHWNTVNMAKPILSKLVIPKFGPSHFSKHVLTFGLQE